jgi:hypothetical protein
MPTGWVGIQYLPSQCQTRRRAATGVLVPRHPSLECHGDQVSRQDGEGGDAGPAEARRIKKAGDAGPFTDASPGT